MKRKLCLQCRRKRLLKFFTIRRASNDGLYYYCKTCHYENIKRDRKTVAGRAKRVREARNRRNRFVAYLRDVKMRKGCKDCGYRKHPAALQFHHVRGKKHRNWAKWVTGWCMKTIKQELKKCVVLCANCHFIRHDKERKLEQS